MEERRRKFTFCLSTGLLLLCLLVIVWGAFVRFSHSGDGCGASWPLCDGSVVPNSSELPVWIEYTHRLSSGLFGLGVLFLWGFVLRFSKKGHPLRRFATGVLLFTISEALIGAGLVLRELVSDNDSFERALWLIGHLLNTLVLLYFLVGCALQARIGDRELPLFPELRHSVPLLCFFLLATAGSIASLSNTLYPSSSLADGIVSDFSSGSPLLVRLRGFHPLLGVLFFSAVIYWWQKIYLRFPHLSERLLWLAGGNVMIGAFTLLSLSPIYAKLLHLLIADLLWMQLVVGSLLLSVYSRPSERAVRGSMPPAVPLQGV